MEQDSRELRDLGADPAYSKILRDCEAALRRVVDPEAANRECLEDQARQIEPEGGVEAIQKRGMFRCSPSPGEDPVMYAQRSRTCYVDRMKVGMLEPWTVERRFLNSRIFERKRTRRCTLA